MDLSRYIDSVRQGVTNAAALADDNTQQVAHRLGTAIDSSTRLALIEALSDAAGEISAELAPSSVEVRMSGQEPEFVVSVSSSSAQPTLLLPQSEEPTATADPDPEDEPQARISLRLPNSVKVRVDEMAASDGVSTNAWLIRAIVDALTERRRGEGWPQPPGAPLGGGVFGPNGPFGAHGIFGAGGPFGPGTRPEGKQRNFDRDRRGPRGGIQGWVR
jgi:hypothetical protein